MHNRDIDDLSITNKSYLESWYFSFKQLTSFLRFKPSYLILGAQKGGTTSLHEYLVSHPGTVASYVKEIHYFDINFQNKESWYRAHFGLRFYYSLLRMVRKAGRVTGDCTPYYLFHPHAPSRASKKYPQIKLIVVLRNPIDRAYSHYLHNKRKGRESRSFEEAIADEQAKMPGETQRLKENPEHDCHYHRHYSYLSRGLYIDQLLRWTSFYPSEQLLVLQSEEMFTSPQNVFSRVLNFLDLEDHYLDSYEAFNKQIYPAKMDRETRAQLNAFFAPYNSRLYEFLNINFNWK